MKYKVGDKVKVREDLEYKQYGGDGAFDVAVGKMQDLKGSIVTITKITQSNKYEIEESDCYWTADMFSGLAEDEPKYYVQLSDDVTWVLNRRTSASYKPGYLSFDSRKETEFVDTKFTVADGLKYLRKFAKNNEVDLTQVEFIPVESEKLFMVKDLSKSTTGDTINFYLNKKGIIY